MKQKLTGAFVALFAALAVFAGSSPAAHADVLTAPGHFTPYITTVTWYAPSPATVADPFAVSQTLKVITCGGISQTDSYSITSRKVEVKYKEFIAAGHLDSPADDAMFNPHDYSVKALPDCVVIPPKPGDKVTTTTSDGTPNCDTGTVEVTTTTTTTPSVYVEVSNTWVDGEPVITASTATREATEAECPPVVVVPTKPDDIVTVTHTTLKPFCDGTTAVATEETATTTTSWTYDAESNTYVKLAPVTVTTNHEVKTPDAPECATVIIPTKPTPPPVVKPTPPVKPTPVVTPTKPTPTKTAAPVLAKPKPTLAAAVVAEPKGALAFTGSRGTNGIFTVGGMIVGLGIFLVLYGRHSAHMAEIERKKNLQ